MLHILWLMIKFILIVLGIVLGLLLLALLLVLFCPVRYRAAVSKNQPDWKAIEGEAGVSWLFRGISFKVRRENGETGFSVRVLGIPVDKLMKRKSRKKNEDFQDTEFPKENRKENPEAENFPEFPGETEEPEKILREENQDTSEGNPETENESFGAADEKKEKKTSEQGLFQKLAGKLTEIRFKIHNIGLTFHKIHDKMEWWKNFIHHPRTQEAFSLVWKHAKYLIRHILPVKVEGNVVFGSENPAVTGKVLALLGMSFPLHKNCIAVTPLFDGENVVEGNIRLKGRIYGIVLVRAAVTIYFNKNVKYVIRRVKHRNHKEG